MQLLKLDSFHQWTWFCIGLARWSNGGSVKLDLGLSDIRDSVAPDDVILEHVLAIVARAALWTTERSINNEMNIK